MRDCIFRGNEMLRNEVNPGLQQAWEKDNRKGYFPFSAAQRIWKKEHCPRINPYGSEDCPYGRDQCTLSYYAAMTLALDAHPDNFVAFARTVAKNAGVDRADSKPLARDRLRTDGLQERARSLRSRLRPRPLDDVVHNPGNEYEKLRAVEDALPSDALYRPTGGWSRVGEMFGANHVRPHHDVRGRNEGEESPDNDADREFDLPRSSPVDPLGDEPQARDPRIHQEGE